MAQIFSSKYEFHRAIQCVFDPLSGRVALVAVLAVARSPYMTRRIFSWQPVQFSHKHHVGDDGIDCRYANRRGNFRRCRIPPTKTCMNCHSVLFNNAPTSSRSARAIAAINPSSGQSSPPGRFVYFNHSIHVNKGVGCSSCHGRSINAAVFQANTLLMQWCVECHRNPERVSARKIRFSIWTGRPRTIRRKSRQAEGRVQDSTTAELTSCSTCHR